MLYKTDDTYSPKLLSNRLVHILDEDLGSCRALAALFHLEGFQTTFSVSVQDYLNNIERRCPDIVIIDLDMDGGLQALQKTSEMNSDVAQFGVTRSTEIHKAVSAMKSGALDVVAKPIDGEYLARAARDALRKDIRVRHLPDGRQVVSVLGFQTLTRRERDVLREIVKGNSNKETGQALDLSARTVEVHRAHIMEKLGARNTADLLRIVLAR